MLIQPDDGLELWFKFGLAQHIFERERFILVLRLEVSFQIIFSGARPYAGRSSLWVWIWMRAVPKVFGQPRVLALLAVFDSVRVDECARTPGTFRKVFAMRRCTSIVCSSRGHLHLIAVILVLSFEVFCDALFQFQSDRTDLSIIFCFYVRTKPDVSNLGRWVAFDRVHVRVVECFVTHWAFLGLESIRRRSQHEGR